MLDVLGAWRSGGIVLYNVRPKTMVSYTRGIHADAGPSVLTPGLAVSNTTLHAVIQVRIRIAMIDRKSLLTSCA